MLRGPRMSPRVPPSGVNPYAYADGEGPDSVAAHFATEVRSDSRLTITLVLDSKKANAGWKPSWGSRAAARRDRGTCLRRAARRRTGARAPTCSVDMKKDFMPAP